MRQVDVVATTFKTFHKAAKFGSGNHALRLREDANERPSRDEAVDSCALEQTPDVDVALAIGRTQAINWIVWRRRRPQLLDLLDDGQIPDE
jgi:hypothetical protein